jgi:hypothetical protein
MAVGETNTGASSFCSKFFTASHPVISRLPSVCLPTGRARQGTQEAGRALVRRPREPSWACPSMPVSPPTSSAGLTVGRVARSRRVRGGRRDNSDRQSADSPVPRQTTFGAVTMQTETSGHRGSGQSRPGRPDPKERVRLDDRSCDGQQGTRWRAPQRTTAAGEQRGRVPRRRPRSKPRSQCPTAFRSSPRADCQMRQSMSDTRRPDELTRHPTFRKETKHRATPQGQQAPSGEPVSRRLSGTDSHPGRRTVRR